MVYIGTAQYFVCSYFFSPTNEKLTNLKFVQEVYGKKEYTLKAYMALFEKVHTVVPAGMSVEVYECVLWAHAHTGVAGEKLTTPNLMNSNTSTRSRKRKR